MNLHQELYLIFAYENGELTEQETLQLFSYLIKNDVLKALQGHYQRTARFYVEQEYLSPSGDILIDLTNL
jgi:hypothetical protein